MADTYTVKRGDTLSGIAQSQLGSASKYKQLAAINGISNPNLIYVGQIIKLTNSGGTSSTTKSTDKAIIKSFGLQSNVDNTLFAIWEWTRSNTENYQLEWQYYTAEKYWFVGNDSTTNYKYSTFSIPANASSIRFRVKPISQKKTVKNKDGSTYETTYWTAKWSDWKKFNVSAVPPEAPSAPSVEIDGYKLTASLENITSNAASIKFQVVKNDATKPFLTYTVPIKTSAASYTCTVDAGAKYKVRCQAIRGNLTSEWSSYSSNIDSVPAIPSGITTCRANSETSVYLEWSSVKNATSYDIEYTTEKRYFDGSNQTTTETGVTLTHYEITGLTSGDEYFFRVRAVNGKGTSGWSGIKSTVIGKAPSAPTTWSSTTTAIVGDPLILYWVHNSEDGSSQSYAELELTINGTAKTYTIKNTTSEEEKDKPSSYSVQTSTYTEGTKILWRVRTSGITNTYGEWSIQRTVDVYAPPTLQLSITDSEGSSLETIETFPFYISGLAGPNTQAPIGYHVTISSNETYVTVDSIGNEQTVSAGDSVYTRQFDTTEALLVEMSANNLDLENGMEYTVTCIVSMNSGLTAESSTTFTVSWSEERYTPNAEIGVDDEAFTAVIRPYCEETTISLYKVEYSSDVYTKTTEKVDSAYGTEVENAVTTTGETVFYGTTADGADIYYCEVESTSLVTGVTLSVYRREFDGAFTELAKGLENSNSTFITDPHPALDYARYRIVATTTSTGAVGYYDVPGRPVGGTAVIIQWDEEWSTFDTTGNEDPLVQPPWTGSFLRLPYNIDVSDQNSLDVELVKYVGRKRPVTYYGTQLGETSSWSVEIPKSDKETLYALRRLAIWTGDVYVREPSGSGYWANISVSFSQKHLEVTIPVTLELTRVEGGV